MTPRGKGQQPGGYDAREQASRERDGMTASSDESEGMPPRPSPFPPTTQVGPAMSPPYGATRHWATPERTITRRPPCTSTQVFAAPSYDIAPPSHEMTYPQAMPLYQMATQLLAAALQLNPAPPSHVATTSAGAPVYAAPSLNDVARDQAESLRLAGVPPPYIVTHRRNPPACDPLPMGEPRQHAPGERSMSRGKTVVIPPPPPEETHTNASYEAPRDRCRRRRSTTAAYEGRDDDIPWDGAISPSPSHPAARPRQVHLGEGSSRSPFSISIQGEPLPPNFYMPNLPVYDGNGDPMEHAQRYHDIMSIYGYSDAVQCRVFSGTLRDAASNWYYRLPPNLINSFQGLATLLVRQFSDIGAQARNKRRREDPVPRRIDPMRRPRRSIPLNVPLVVAVEAARNQGLLPRPRSDRGLQRCCSHHGYREYSPGENEITDIEPLVRQGHLLEYVDIGKLMDWADIGGRSPERSPCHLTDDEEE